MRFPSHRAVLALASVGLLGAALTGCGGGGPARPSDGAGQSATASTPKETPVNTEDPAQTLAAQQKLLEEQMPEIADAFGSPGVKRLAQTTCTGQYEPRTMGEIVEWTTSAALSVADLDEARAAAAQAEPYLTSHGWTITHADHFDPEAPLNTIFTAKHTESGLGLHAFHDQGGGESLLFIDGGGPCIETPEGYQTLRSHLDPGFGDGTPEYDPDAERDSPLHTPQPTHSNPGPSTEEPGPATDG